MDWKQIISGIVIGAILGIAGTIFIIGQRVAKLEVKLAEKNPVVIEEPVPPPPSPSCSTARIIGLSNETVGVDRNTSIKWEPSNCLMVIQAYQGGNLINEFEKNPKRSGEVTLREAVTGKDQKLRLGMIELKIWVPGENIPAQEGVRVQVE